MSENFNFSNEDKEIRARNDMELIKKYFDDQMSWLYWSISQSWDNWRLNVKRIKVLPERLLRRYIEEEEIIQELLQYEYVVWYIKFEPTREFRNFKDEFKSQKKREWVEPKMISQFMREMREQWNMTKEFRYLTRINRHWQFEQSFRSFKKPIYIGTTSDLFWRWNDWSFYSKNWFRWEWKIPYLAMDTNKQSFIHKITRLWFKEIIIELRKILESQQNAWLDDDFNIIRNPMIDVHKNNIIDILKNPLKQLTEEDDKENIDENDQDLSVLDFD